MEKLPTNFSSLIFLVVNNGGVDLPCEWNDKLPKTGDDVDIFMMMMLVVVRVFLKSTFSTKIRAIPSRTPLGSI